MGSGTDLQTEIYVALMRLMSITVHLTDAAHRHYSTSEPDAYFFVAGVDRSLHEWHRSLPEHLRWSERLAATAPRSYFLMHQQYHTLLILLYRPFTYDDDAGDQAGAPTSAAEVVRETARQTCSAHAVTVAEIIAQYCRRFDIRTMFVTGMQHAATSAIAIFEGMVAAKLDKQVPLGHLRRLADVLNAHAKTYVPAKVMSGILFDVIDNYRSAKSRPAGQSHSAFRSHAEQVTTTPYTSHGRDGETSVSSHRSHAMHPSVNIGLDHVDDQSFAPDSYVQAEPQGSGAELIESTDALLDLDDSMWEQILSTLSMPRDL